MHLAAVRASMQQALQSSVMPGLKQVRTRSKTSPNQLVQCVLSLMFGAAVQTTSELKCYPPLPYNGCF